MALEDIGVDRALKRLTDPGTVRQLTSISPLVVISPTKLLSAPGKQRARNLGCGAC